MNEAANDSAGVSGQDRKIPPTLGTNQIAGFGGFSPLASLEKNNIPYADNDDDDDDDDDDNDEDDDHDDHYDDNQGLLNCSS